MAPFRYLVVVLQLLRPRIGVQPGIPRSGNFGDVRISAHFGIPLGLLSDRIGRKKAMILGVVIYVLAAAMQLIFINPNLILLTAFISGAGHTLILLASRLFYDESLQFGKPHSSIQLEFWVNYTFRRSRQPFCRTTSIVLC